MICGCGAPARGDVCQRGHRLTEAWSPAAREAALAARRRHMMEKGGSATRQIISSVGDAHGDAATNLINAGKALDTQRAHTRNGVYTPGREELHKAIIRRLLAGSTAQAHPKAIFTAGGAASGKSALAGRADDPAHNLPVPAAHVYVNPDDIKQMLPEYGELRQAGRGELSAAATHEESSDIAKQLTAIAMRRHRHLVIDGTGNSRVGKFGSKLRAAQQAGYDVDARYAHIPVADAEARENARAARTGRKVDHTVLRQQHQTVSASYLQDVSKMKGIHVHVYSTQERTPRLIAEMDKAGRVKVHDRAQYAEMLRKANP